LDVRVLATHQHNLPARRQINQARTSATVY